MEKSFELLEELTMSKKEVGENTGSSPQYLWKIKRGSEKAEPWRKRLIQFARIKADKLKALADEAEREAA